MLLQYMPHKLLCFSRKTIYKAMMYRGCKGCYGIENVHSLFEGPVITTLFHWTARLSQIAFKTECLMFSEYRHIKQVDTQVD